MDNSNRIFGFWTGDNEMPEIRRQSWETFPETGLDPLLITPDNLGEWIVPDHPFHPAYELLSLTQRGDYLKAYFMYHHGGGYSDIKRQSGSWLPAVEEVLRSKRLMGAGYRELRGRMPWIHNEQVEGKPYLLAWPVPWLVAKLTTDVMRALYPLMIGNGAAYFKPKTLYCRIWLSHLERRLDILLPALRKNPATHPRDVQGDPSGYPVPWAFVMGGINSPLSLAFCWALSRTLPPQDFENYR